MSTEANTPRPEQDTLFDMNAVSESAVNTTPEVGHSGNLEVGQGRELPVEQFDNTPLSQAVEKKLIGNTPDSPAPLHETAVALGEHKKSRKLIAGAGLALAGLIGAGAGIASLSSHHERTTITSTPDQASDGETTPTSSTTPTTSPTSIPSTLTTAPSSEVSSSATPVETVKPEQMGLLANTPESAFSNAIDQNRVNELLAQYPELKDFLSDETIATQGLARKLNKQDITAQEELIHKLLGIHDVRAFINDGNPPVLSQFVIERAKVMDEPVGNTVVAFTDAVRRSAKMVAPLMPADDPLEAVNMAFLNDENIELNKQAINSDQIEGYPEVDTADILAVRKYPASGYTGDILLVATMAKYQPDQSGHVLNQFRWNVIIPVGSLPQEAAPGHTLPNSDVAVCFYEHTFPYNN